MIVAETRRCDRAVFHFSEVPDIVRTAVKTTGCLATRLPPNRLPEVRSIFGSIEEEFRRPTALSEVRYEIALLQLTLLALGSLDLRPAQPLYNVPRERVERALAWYTEHLGESPSLNDVAKNVHISPSHLRRHFYQQLGRSPTATFNRLRMQKATTLLVNSSLTLDQIAETCGYHSASDFCRSFKLHFKVTPHSWRQEVNSAAGRVTKPRAASSVRR
jgi:AraC family transcriptional regulator